MNVLIVYAKAGGGHQSVASALQEGFRRRYGDAVSVSLLDIMEDYAPFPMNKFPAIYPALTRGGGQLWRALYASTDGDIQARLISRGWWPMLHKRVAQVVALQEIDLVVSVYPLLNRVIGKILGRLSRRPKFAILVTDLGTAHALWVSQEADHYLAPTSLVYSRLLALGVPPEKISLVGLPVHPNFSHECADRAALRASLGLCADCPVVLVMGGADGMGRMGKILEAMDERQIRATFVAVAGRNTALKAQLDNRPWRIDLKTLGYVATPRWMRAADLLLTKAGPSTIAEALASRLPMVLTGYLPGQERENVTFVESIGAGIYAPRPQKMAAIVETLTSPQGANLLAEMKARMAQAGQENATCRSVEALYRLGNGHRPMPKRTPWVETSTPEK